MKLAVAEGKTTAKIEEGEREYHKSPVHNNPSVYPNPKHESDHSAWKFLLISSLPLTRINQIGH